MFKIITEICRQFFLFLVPLINSKNNNHWLKHHSYLTVHKIQTGKLRTIRLNVIENDLRREDGSQCASTGRQSDKRCQCSMRSVTEAKAQQPSPELDISRTNSCAWAIATSNGGFRGLFCDSKPFHIFINQFYKEHSHTYLRSQSLRKHILILAGHGPTAIRQDLPRDLNTLTN